MSNSIIKIDNINNKIHDIKYKNTKFEKIISENLHLLPNFKHSTLSFNIYNTRCSFVNALRRCIQDEILTHSLYFDITDIKSDDKFILNDFISKRTESISLLQSIDPDTKFSLSVKNTTSQIISINTNMIMNDNTNDKTIYFNQNIKLCELRPNSYLNIKNIHIKSEIGIIDNVYSIGRPSYEIINFDMNKHQSLNSDPTDFTFYMYNNGNISSFDILTLCITTLDDRLTNIINLVSVYDDNLINDELIINKTKLITSYYIKNEYHTLGNIIVDYMFELDTSTQLLNYNNDHPLKNEISINTDNTDSDKLLLQACNNIKKDLKIVFDIMKKLN